MIGSTRNLKVWAWPEPADLRKGYGGLSQLVRRIPRTLPTGLKILPDSQMYPAKKQGNFKSRRFLPKKSCHTRTKSCGIIPDSKK